MKKHLFFASVSILALAASAASAADLPVKAPPMVAPASVYDWGGFYVGINGGGGFEDPHWLDTTPTDCEGLGTPCELGRHTASGGTIGGQVGWRTQSGAWVWGVDLQGNWAHISGSHVDMLDPTFTDSSTVRDFGILALTGGWAVNNVLFYGKAGVAWVDNHYSTSDGVQNFTAKDVRWAPAVGVGFEYGFSRNWSFAVEYDHIFAGHHDVTMTDQVGDFFGASMRQQDLDLITARLNYRFGGPVVARY